MFWFLGDTALGTQIQQFKPLSVGGTCTDIISPICTAVNITTLDWYLHGNHKYYVSVKVSNTAGLVTIESSDPYIHNVQVPDEGVVFDVDPNVSKMIILLRFPSICKLHLPDLTICLYMYSQTCIKRSPLVQRRSGLVRQVIS